jgi:hypothetical protein
VSAETNDVQRRKAAVGRIQRVEKPQTPIGEPVSDDGRRPRRDGRIKNEAGVRDEHDEEIGLHGPVEQRALPDDEQRQERDKPERGVDEDPGGLQRNRTVESDLGYVRRLATCQRADEDVDRDERHERTREQRPEREVCEEAREGRQHVDERASPAASSRQLVGQRGQRHGAGDQQPFRRATPPRRDGSPVLGCYRTRR